MSERKSQEEKVAALRERLATLLSDAWAVDEVPSSLQRCGVMSPELRADFDFVWAMLTCCVKTLVRENREMHAPAEYYERLAHVLQFQVCVSYQNWQIRPEVTDAEILAHASAIEAGQLAQLFDLGEQAAGTCVAPRTTDAKDFRDFLGNLTFFAAASAIFAKKLNAFSAARAYLMVESILQRVLKDKTIVLNEMTRMRLIELFKTGEDELSIARDYASLGDWDAIRRDELLPKFGGAASAGDKEAK